MQTGAEPDGAMVTLLNFIPFVTLCAVVYAAGAFTQRVKSMEKEIAELRKQLLRSNRRIHELSNFVTRTSGRDVLRKIREQEKQEDGEQEGEQENDL